MPDPTSPEQMRIAKRMYSCGWHHQVVRVELLRLDARIAALDREQDILEIELRASTKLVEAKGKRIAELTEQLAGEKLAHNLNVQRLEGDA